MNIRLEHLASRMVIGKRRKRQSISLEKCPASPFCHAASSTKSKGSRLRGLVGQATVDYLTEPVEYRKGTAMPFKLNETK